MEENKYYTAQIEDLHEGLEFEYNTYDEDRDEFTGVWIKSHFDSRDGLGHDLTHVLNDGQVRIPYLSKEDIEAEGFKKDGDQFKSVKTYLGGGTGDDRKLCIYLDEEDYTLEIWYKSNRGDLFVKFEGVVKNKSEFKKILKMIGV